MPTGYICKTSSVATRFGRHGMPRPPLTLTFDHKTGMRVSSKVVNCPSKFGFCVLKLFAMYVTDRQTDKSNLWSGHNKIYVTHHTVGNQAPDCASSCTVGVVLSRGELRGLRQESHPVGPDCASSCTVGVVLSLGELRGLRQESHPVGPDCASSCTVGVVLSLGELRGLRQESHPVGLVCRSSVWLIMINLKYYCEP